MAKCRARVVLVVLSILLVCSMVIGVLLGSARFTLGQMAAALFSANGDATIRLIVLQLRLPRVIAAALAGMGLAVSGLLLQTATDNDLCSPNVIGINAGAGFCVMLFLCLFPMAYHYLPLAAFLGALCTTFFVIGISFTAGHHTPKTTVILAGVAIAALLNAGISFLSQLYPDILSAYASFSAGGFSGIHGQELYLPAIMIGIGVICAALIARQLNLLCLGDEIAKSLGVPVKQLRFFSLVLASALCAAVVSFAGLLGFVGLIVPHAARRLVGVNVQWLIPTCSLLGAVLVMLADLAARTLFTPAELPAGILLAALGAPFFLYLLFKRRSSI